MPTAAQHSAHYQRSRNLLDNHGLVRADNMWAATVAFYAAVHLVERLADFEGKHHTAHGGPNSRRWYLTNHAQHRVLLARFATLQRASELARYGSIDDFNVVYPGDDVQTLLVDNCLHTIEQYVLNHPPPAPPAAAAGS